MPEIAEQIQSLISEGKTEEAFDTLINWLKTQQSATLNEVILLKSRYQEVEHDASLDLISAEEASRAHNQINFSLLKLVTKLEGGTSEPNAIPPQRRGWLLALTSGLLILVLAMFVLRILYPSRMTRSDHSSQTQSTASATMSNSSVEIQFPEGKEVHLQTSGSQVTYTVLEATSEKYNTENQKVTFKIRCFLHAAGGATNFWDSDFRLVINNLPYAPKSNLDEVVEPNSFKDGEVYFIIPKDLHAADLTITFYSDHTQLPIKW